MAHTLGPWLKRLGREGVLDKWVIRAAKGGWPIAVLPCGNDAGKLFDHRFPTQTERRANACLIATAPDMLAALESIVKLRGVPTSIQPDWTAIHSLIQKAKGK